MKHFIFFIIFLFSCTLAAQNVSANTQYVDIHGFLSQGYLQTNENNFNAETKDGTFQFNEMGINFTTFVTQDLKVGCQLFARDLGEVGNDEVTISWAFAEYTYRNWLGLRAGLFKMPWGLYNEVWDIDTLRTSILMPSSVYPEPLRDGIASFKGFELFGSIPLNIMGMLQYRLMYGQKGIELDSGAVENTKKLIGLDVFNYYDPGKTTIGRLIWSPPIDGLRISAFFLRTSINVNGTGTVQLASLGPDPITFTMTMEADPADNYVFSVEYIYGNFKFNAENLWYSNHSTYSFANGTYTREDDKDTKEPFYAGLGYRFFDWFEAAYYYSYDTNFMFDGLNDLTEHCLSFRFDINPSWLVKLEVHMMDGTYGAESAEDDGSIEEDWMLYAAKLSYTF